MNEDELMDFESLSEFFKALGDPTRLQILFALKGGERCVNCISENVEMSVSAVSHQLRILKDKRFVSSRREGKSIFYSLKDQHVTDIISEAMEHVLE